MNRSIPRGVEGRRGPERIPFYRNVRILGMLFQVLFLAVAGIATYILYDNVRTGLASSNLTLSFGFLDDRAGFDLGETAIRYSASDTYLRAIIVGLLNTLKVGLAGVVLCTVLGVTVGVLRLSANWLLRTLATGYVELLRNTPLAVQLIFWYYAIILSIPPRSDNATRILGDVYLSQIGIALPWLYGSYSFSRWLPWLAAGIVLFVAILLWRRRAIALAERPGVAWPAALAAAVLVAAAGYFVTAARTSLPAGISADITARSGVGTVYLDADGNGERERGEETVPFAPVIVSIAEGRLETTSQNLIESRRPVYSTFRFPLIDIDEYETAEVEFVDPDQAADLSLHFTRYPSIGFVYRDANGNDEYDEGEETVVEDGVARAFNGIRLAMNLTGFERRLVSDRSGTIRLPIFTPPPAEEGAAAGAPAGGGGGGLGALFRQAETTAGTIETEVEFPVAGPLVYSEPTVPRSSYFGGVRLTTPFLALLLGLAIYTSAFVAEIVRGGIQAVPRGQSEAARALGLSPGHTFFLVVFPQALRVIIPPMISQYLNLMKNSSLAILVTFSDFFQVSNTVGNQTGQFIAVYVIILLGYLSLSLVFSLILNIVNARMALVER